MKVCFIAGTLGRGGAERQLLYMLRALQDEGIDTRVLCLTKGEAYEAQIKELGIKVDWIGSSNNRIVRVLKIMNNIRKQPADILQSSHFYTNIYAAIAGRLLAIPSSGAIRSDLRFEFAVNKFYRNWQLKLPGHLIANSELAVERAVSHGVNPNKIDFLRNVVEISDNNGIQRVGEKKSLNILFAGRLGKEKRPELFVKLASQILRDLQQFDVRFEIAGDGPLRSKLEQLVNNHVPLSTHFSFLGEQVEMSGVYRRTDILVLTSEHEGTPNVVLEAMAHGIPVVATRVGGVPEILSDKCGILVDPADFEELVAATTKLILDPDLRRDMGRNGQDYVASNHSFKYLQKRLVGIYSKVLRDEQK